MSLRKLAIFNVDGSLFNWVCWATLYSEVYSAKSYVNFHVYSSYRISKYTRYSYAVIDVFRAIVRSFNISLQMFRHYTCR